MFTLALYLLGVGIFGLAVFPGALFVWAVWKATAFSPMLPRLLFLCLGGAAAFFIFGIALILIVGVLRLLLRLDLHQGEFSMVSPSSAQWALANALYLVVAVTFMDFILITPLAPFFYRLMGAKVGRNVQINSKYCADLSLMEIGDNAVIGGHATVICHSFERHRLILRPVKIGKGAIVGLNAIVLPGAEIGEGATVAAGAIVPKDTKVPPHTTYMGV